MACSYAYTDSDGKPVLITGKANFQAWLAENLDKVAPGWNTSNQGKVQNKAPTSIDDFGEKIKGARKDMQASVSKEWTDDEIASQPFSKIWPATDIDAISDPFEAAVMFAAREEVPAKPRVSYKLKAWVAKVKMFRELVSRVIGDVGRDRYLERMKEYGGLDGFRSKIMLLEALDRSQWKRIGQVAEYPNAYILNDGKKVPAPQSVVEIDGKRERFDGSGSVLDALDKINEQLGVAAEPKKMQFEVRGREGFYGINKKGDKEYRKLKTFATPKEAFAYIKDNYDDLVAAWDGVKDRDNVGKADVRNDTNRPRTGSDWRKGKDVTPAQFSDAFGFRGVQFGNWVSQGAGGKDRQGMLNQAYDALMDLADIVGVPPKAISLNGSLGLAFGARGSGNASAHYEPSNLVINLTKTKGAGTLAHEWFHALDNYFSRQRGGEVRIGRGVNAQEAYRTQNYITYRPEPMYVHKTQRSTPITKAQLERYHDRSPQSDYYSIQNWQVDPTHPQGVRPEVERAFADLVEALDNSPMKVRSAKNDKGSDGYWSRIIERGARSFENYVIHKMRLKGYDNDYLANVRKIDDFPRDAGRYPYLLDEEVAPIAEAFDNLFSEVKTKETEQGVALFSRGKSGSVIHREDFDAKMRQFKRAFPSVQIVGHDSDQAGSVPKELRASIKRQGATNDVKGAYHDGSIHIFRNAIPDIPTLEFTVLHEATHFGLSGFMGASLDEVMLDINRLNPNIAKAASKLQRQYGYSVARSTEEALADLGGDMVKVKGWKKLIAAVRDWLRKHGFVTNWTDNDIAALVMRARDYAKDKNATTVYRGSVFSQGDASEANLKLSRASLLTPAQRSLTKTDKFAEWFGDSKMKAQDGTPLLFMHGTPSSFEAFSNDALGSSSSHTSAGLGHFFTRDMATAQKYAQGGNVLKGWLRIERPYVMPLKEAQGFEDTKASAARRAELQKQSYDGAVILDDQGKPWATVAFHPWQYKTTDNRGTFDEFDDRMRFSRAGQAELGDLTAEQQEAVERVFGKPKTTVEKVKEFTKDWKKNLIQGVFDQYAPIKELDSKAYVLARLAKGGDSTLEAMLLYGKVSVDADGAYQVDYDGKNMNGFAKAMGKLDGEHDRFLAWVSGMRAEKLAGLGLENLMTPKDIKSLQSLNKGKLQNGKERTAAYAEALRALNEFNDSVMKLAVDSGLIDEATRQMYKDTPYVPFYRLSEEEAIQGPTVSKGLVNQYAWKKLKGGTDKLNEDLMGNLLKNWSHLITASANNRAAKQILDTAAKMGVATDMTGDVVALDTNGQPIYRGNTKGLVRYRGEIKRRIPAGQTYVENGQPKVSDGTAEISYVGDRYFKVDDPHLMDAIASIGFTQKVWKPLSAFKRYLTFGVTVNPTFKIRNLIRDSIQAVGTADLSANPVKNILMGAKATDMLSQTRAQMLASGGMLRFGSSEGGYSAHVRRLIEKGVDPAHILDDSGKLKAFWKHKILPAFEAYQELGDRSENVNRAALYEQLKAKGMSHAEASFWARDMMDFSMSGKWQAVRTLTSVVPFMNARLQGMYKLGRATKQDYKRMGATLAAVSMASIALMLAYGDDDDWKKREDWDRDNSWWFKIGETAYRIPKPFEIGAIGTIAERSLELMISDEMTGQRFGNRMRDLVMQNLSMNPTPQLVKPMIDLYANKDSFSGRDIETQGMERLRPEDRYNERTSEVARFLGSIGLPNPAQLIMGRVETLSPVQIDHLIRGYLSWLGTSATTVLDYGLRPAMDRGERPERRLKDVFLVGNFVESLPAGSSRYVTEFYNQAKEIEQMYASYQQAIKEGDMEEASAIREKDADKFAKRGLFNAIKRQESEISAQMRQIERDKELSSSEKRDRLTELEQRRDRLARRALG